MSVGEWVRYPGDRVLQIRNETLAKGIPVEPSILGADAITMMFPATHQLFSLTEIRFKFLWFDTRRVISILEMLYRVVLLTTIVAAARVA
jgi:hypothetical protein